MPSILSTLIFHRVRPERDELLPGEITAGEFDAICGWVARWMRVLPLDEAVPALQRGSLPARAACITFDDGYADNRTVALPILQRHGLCATFFVATGFLERGRMWNDTIIEALRATRRTELNLRPLGLEGIATVPTATLAQRRTAIGPVLRALKHLPPAQRSDGVHAVLQAAGVHDTALPQDLMMSGPQVRELRAAGMQVGAHTVSHPILARVDDAQARQEIAASRETLQGLLGEPVRLFAYPNGQPGQDYTARDVALVRQLGFSAAVSTAWGAARRTADPFQLPRFTPWDRSPLTFGLRLLRNMLTAPQPLVAPGG